MGLSCLPSLAEKVCRLRQREFLAGCDVDSRSLAPVPQIWARQLHSSLDSAEAAQQSIAFVRLGNRSFDFIHWQDIMHHEPDLKRHWLAGIKIAVQRGFVGFRPWGWLELGFKEEMLCQGREMMAQEILDQRLKPELVALPGTEHRFSGESVACGVHEGAVEFRLGHDDAHLKIQDVFRPVNAFVEFLRGRPDRVRVLHSGHNVFWPQAFLRSISRGRLPKRQGNMQRPESGPAVLLN